MHLLKSWGLILSGRILKKKTHEFDMPKDRWTIVKENNNAVKWNQYIQQDPNLVIHFNILSWCMYGNEFKTYLTIDESCQGLASQNPYGILPCAIQKFRNHIRQTNSKICPVQDWNLRVVNSWKNAKFILDEHVKIQYTAFLWFLSH